MDHPNQGGDKDEQFLALLAQDGGISFEEFVSLFPDLSPEVAGTVQHGAPTAPAAPEFAYNEIQTLSSLNKELNKQQFDQLFTDTLKMVQPPTMPLGPPDASYSIDQFVPPSASRTQLPENQKLAGIQSLIQEQLDPAAEKLKRKRAADRKYRQNEKEKKQKLVDENEVKDQLLNALRAQIQILEDQLQKERQLREKYTKVEAEKEYWKKQYLLLNESSENNSREENQLRQKVEAMEKQICLFQKNLGKLCIEKKQVMMAETSEEPKSDN